jgi:AAA family ATPase
LDYALRSRFEEDIEFILPDEEERREIIEMYTKSMPLPVNINVGKLAHLSKGMSGRDIKDRLLKVALHKAISEDQDSVTWENFQYALKHHEKEKNEPKDMFA